MQITSRSRTGRFSAKQAVPTWIQLGGLLSIATVFGGGGVGAGTMNLVVQICALIILACNGPRVRAFFQLAPTPLKWLTIATISIPALQLLPLPADAWHGLPGRDLLRESLGLTGDALSSYPFSVSPYRTALSLVGLIAPFTVLILAFALDEDDRGKILAVIVGLGVLNLLFAIAQTASSNQFGNLYDRDPTAYITGTFAYKNTTGLFFDICILATLGAASFINSNRIVRFSLWVAFGLGALLSFSRSASAILPFVIAASVVAIASSPRDRIRRTPKFRWIASIAIGAVIAVTAVAVLNDTKVGQAFSKYTIEDHARMAIWQDARRSAERFWPMGAGMGTFDAVFQIDESLERVPNRRAGRAHNDYLELSIEAGVIGIALLLAWFAYVARNAVARPPLFRDPQRLFAVGGIVCFAAQSAIDYPLRNQAILCLLGFMIALLGRSAKARNDRNDCGSAGTLPSGRGTANI